MTEYMTITADLVGEDDRLLFLPRIFGVLRMTEAEALTYAYMSKLSADYRGAYWHFYQLSNGGFYMAPDGQDRYGLEWDGNGYSGEVSADAAGLIATLFMLGHMHEKHGGDDLAQLYHYVRDYAFLHPENEQITAALD